MIVHLPTKLRVVLEGVGNFIWRRIAKKSNRADIVEALTAHYGVARITVSADLDDLIEELIDAGILVLVSD